jgi:hypothetical protein
MRVQYVKSTGSISLSLLLITSTLVVLANTIPEASASGSNRFVVWEGDAGDDTTIEKPDIFFRRSTDNGETWKPTVNLSNNPGPSKIPQIVVSGSNVYVAWLQTNYADQLPNIFLRRSTDNGATWDAKINISSSGTVVAFFKLVASGSNVYVVWENEDPDDLHERTDIFFRRSADNGASWQPKKNLSNNEPDSSRPQIAVSGSNVYVTWYNGGTNLDQSMQGILFRRSLDGGATWKSIVRVDDDNSGNPERVAQQIAASGSNVYVVWSGHVYRPDNSANTDILLRRSTDNGATWAAEKNVSDSVKGSGEPQFSVSGSKVYVGWMEEWDIIFRRSTDNGSTWKSMINLSNNLGDSFAPHVVVSGSNVYSFWTQRNVCDDYTPCQTDIFFRRSDNNGATWKTKVNLSNNGDSLFPDVAVSGSSVYVVWVGSILFQRTINNGATWESPKTLSSAGNNPQMAL